MFQNIANEYQERNLYEDAEVNKKDKRKKILQQFFTKQNIAIYIVSFMLSTVGLGQAIAPFGLAMLAAVCSNEIPIWGAYIATLIGTWIGFGTNSFFIYFLTTLVFMAVVLLVKPKYQDEERNEKKKLGIHLFFSTFIVQIIGMFFHEFLIYDVLSTFMISITSCVFYKIFANSITVIREFGIKRAFTIEEVMGASLMLAIAFTALGNLSVFGFSIRNILCILLVMVLGWKQGILVGTTAGVTIGTVLGILSNQDPILVAAFALSGMLAGIFNKLGKIGVIVGFIIGTALLTYASNGGVSVLIYFKEIVIASLGLLLVPKTMEINIEEIIGKTKLLPTSSGALEQKDETVQRLNSMSETISEIAKSYQEAAATVVEEKELAEIDKLKQEFLEELGMNLEGLEDNMIYDDIVDSDDSIISDLFMLLIEKDRIDNQDVLNVFAKYNNYIIGFDDEEISQNIQRDISKIVNAINTTYHNVKADFVIEKKVQENKKTISNQLDGVSKAISSLADDLGKSEEEKQEDKREEITLLLKQKGIQVCDLKLKQEKDGKYIISLYTEACNKELEEECKKDKIEKVLSKALGEKVIRKEAKCAIKAKQEYCKQTYMSDDNYTIQFGIAKATKEGSSVSGDTTLQTKLEDGKVLLALSDGMGSGPNAQKSSKIAIKMLERLLTSGFDKDVSFGLINSTINLNTDEDTFATLDISIFDLYEGTAEFIKNGACPTFIKEYKNVQLIKAMSLPAGILNEVDFTAYDRDLKDGDIIVMCSDGILEANSEYKNKELWIQDILNQLETTNAQKIADIILQEAIDYNIGKPKDDMTIIVAKVMKEKSPKF